MKPRILVVEDEVLIAMLVADAIEAEGFEVIGPCQSVARSLELLAKPGSCDGAILDASLRGESALPVAQALKAQEIPFVVTTGYDASQLAGEMAAAPILAKPLNTDALVVQLRHMLSLN